MTGDYWDAVHDVSNATDVRAVMTGMPDKLHEQAATLRRQHDTITENVRVAPEVAEAMGDYATTASSHASAYGDVAATLLTVHERDFERIDAGTQADAAWDVSRNQ